MCQILYQKSGLHSAAVVQYQQNELNALLFIVSKNISKNKKKLTETIDASISGKIYRALTQVVNEKFYN